MVEVAGQREAARVGVAAAARRSVLAARLVVFVGERFPPLAYGPLIVALVLCGWTAAALASGRQPELGWASLGATAAVALSFLQLRLLDEIRDADVDRLVHPDRPVPRGLVTTHELRACAVLAAVVGLAATLALGATPAIVFGLITVVIWMLGSEQPRRVQIRYGVVGDALLHSIIAPGLLLFVWLSAAPVGGPAALVGALALAWGASLALEVSRKTLRAGEERPGLSTYSAELGRPRALLLAALAISVSCLGAAAFAVAVGAPPPVTVPPFVGAVAVPLAARRFGATAGTGTVRLTTTALVLALLLWPVVVLLGRA